MFTSVFHGTRWPTRFYASSEIVLKYPFNCNKIKWAVGLMQNKDLSLDILFITNKDQLNLQTKLLWQDEPH